MKFTPKSEKEIAEENLWPAGEYSCEVIEAEDRISKVKPDGSGGNEMIYLKLKVYSDDSGYIFVDDYLLESMAYKLRHAADTFGLLNQYNGGILSAEDFKGKAGRIKLFIQKSKDPQYSDKNAVKDYIKSSDEPAVNGVAPSSPVAAPVPVDDTIPF